MILTLIVAVPCAMLGRRIERKQRERAALKTIEDYGGAVGYDYQFDHDGSLIVDAEPPGPKWLRYILGNEFFAEVTCYFSESPADDAETARLTNAFQELPYLKTVSMCAPELTDTGLANFARLTQVETLRFMMSRKPTDTGLRYLKRIRGLRSLSIEGNFSAAAKADLQKALPNCEID